MVFSDLVFLYIFFPSIFILYYICKKRSYRNIILLIFSLIFYSWSEPKYILLMLSASFIAYISGILQDKFQREESFKFKKITFVITLVFLISNLLFFKYLNFIGTNIASLLHVKIQLPEIILPIGISFYTFQILSYVIDLYWGNIKVQKNFFYLTLYVSFFPQLIAGPIVRYQTIEEEILYRKESIEDIVLGLKRFIIGLSKKIIIANNVSMISEIIYKSSNPAFGTVFYWIAALAYTLQIYFDFSGYSDMAIGLGKIFGFHFLENFNYPYISLSVTEFWRRWHISLSTWFRDYVYIPLGGNRVSKTRWIFNIFIVWLLTGFWHGAEWNFIFWGLYYFVFLLLEKFLLGKHLEKTPSFLRWIYTFLVINLGWVLFNITDFKQLFVILNKMFIYRPSNLIGVMANDLIITKALIYIPLGLILSFPIFKNVKKSESNFIYILENILYLALLLLNIIFILSSKFNPFIYFRF